MRGLTTVKPPSAVSRSSSANIGRGRASDGGQRGQDRGAPMGHSLARLVVGPPPPAAPLQAAGLFDAYQGAKGKVGRGYDRVSGLAGRAATAVKKSAPGRAVASAYHGIKGAKNRLVTGVKSTGLYRKGAAIHGDAKAIGEDLNKTPGFQKFRAVLGMLGIAGGYQQGYGSPGDEGRGAEARGAFRGKWEKYLAGLPPEKQAAARLKYSLPEADAQPQSGPQPVGGLQPPSGPQPQRQSGPQEIEMQEFSSNRSPVGGIAPPRNRFDEHFEEDN